jgi:3-hydroxybutyryl-CoA dehydrogenase
MGRGISQVCASAGCTVLLFDANEVAASRAIEAIRAELSQLVGKGKLPQAEADGVLARVAIAERLEDLCTCDVIVEAIIEELDVKQKLMRDLEGIVNNDCLLATNTSSLSVTAIAAVCSAPGRVVGWHFFNPVPRMKVVEVIRTPITQPEAVEALVALSTKIGHRPVVTSDSPGFVVNHAGRAFVTEGLKLLAERAADHPVLDAILRSAGFRMGPFELLDLTGLDVSVPAMEAIHAQYYGDDRLRPVAFARTRLQAGLLGRKSGAGFYRYDTERTGGEPCAQKAECGDAKVWWPRTGPMAVPDTISSFLPPSAVSERPEDADVVLLAPLSGDLSSSIVDCPFDPSRVIGIDPIFGGTSGVSLMVSPATSSDALSSIESIFSSISIPTFVVSDSPGFVAPRVVACVVNLACEMAQQGIAAPTDIDIAVKLGLGYPFGPFEWGDRLGAKRIVEILRGLVSTFGDQRYRPSPWLVRRAGLGLPLSAPDRRTTS